MTREWKREGEIRVDFDETFYAVERGGRLLFVTESGTVHAVLDRGPDEGKRAVAIRRAGDDPVRVILDDADAGRTYAFTERQWFELGAKIEPRPFALEAPADDAVDPQRSLSILAQCAKAIPRAELKKPEAQNPDGQKPEAENPGTNEEQKAETKQPEPASPPENAVRGPAPARSLATP